MLGFIKDMLDQVWTLLGMFIAWFVLDGSAKDIVGWAILWSLVIWMTTYPIRHRKEKEEKESE